MWFESYSNKHRFWAGNDKGFQASVEYKSEFFMQLKTKEIGIV